MDSTKIIIPTIICLTIAVVFYRKIYSKKSKKVAEKSKKEKTEDESKIKEEKNNINEDNIKQEEDVEKVETDKKEIKEDISEKEKEKKRELTYNIIFDKFCDYIQKNKLVSVEAISEKLNKTKEETIKFLRELENEGKMVGFLGKDDEYFYLTTKELDLLNNILLNSKNKNISEDELESQFKEIVKQGQQSII